MTERYQLLLHLIAQRDWLTLGLFVIAALFLGCAFWLEHSTMTARAKTLALNIYYSLSLASWVICFFLLTGIVKP